MRTTNKKLNTSPTQNNTYYQPLYQTRQQRLERLRLQRAKLIQDKISHINQNIKWAFQLTISLLINYNQSFVSKYTILYKSYMILTAFVLTIVGNYFYVDNTIQNSTVKDKGLFADEFPLQSWLQVATYVLPLKGKFSLLFFQLMLLTTIQILYQTTIQLHYRFKSYLYHKKKTQRLQQQYDQQKTQYLKQVDLLSKYIKAKMQQQQQCEKYQQQQRRYNKNSSDQQQVFVSKAEQIVMPLKFLLQNCKQINGRKLLFETKFLYLFALMYAQNILWQGIVIKRWKQRFVHLFIISCCVVEFLIWTMINIVLQASQNIQFGDKQFIQLGPNCQISLGMY